MEEAAYKLALKMKKKKKKSATYSRKNALLTANSQDRIISGNPDDWSMFIFTSHT